MKRQNHIPFTAKKIESLPIPKSDYTQFYSDKIAGLGCRVYANGTKSFFWWRKIAGRALFVKLGEFPASSVAAVIADATERNGKLQEAIRHNFQDGHPFERKREPTLKELIASYIVGRVEVKAAKKERDPKKAIRDLAYLTKPFSHWFERKLSQISEADVAKLHGNLTAEGSPIWADRVCQTIKRLFHFAYNKKLFKGRNPVLGLEFNGDVQRARYFSDDEERRFFREVGTEEDVDLKHMILIAYHCAVRKGNLCAMRWDEIEEGERLWIIPAPKTKSNETYRVPLDETVMGVLATRAKDRTKGNAWVFPHDGTASGHRDEIPRESWVALLQRAQIENFHWHDLRSCRATRLATNFVPREVIARFLGHSDLRSTAVYARIADQAVREAISTGNRAHEKLLRAKPVKGLLAAS